MFTSKLNLPSHVFNVSHVKYMRCASRVYVYDWIAPVIQATRLSAVILIECYNLVVNV